jgi:hypothetical protein
VEVGLRGVPRFRVRGARIIRWLSVKVPFPIFRGVKILDELPRGALGLGACHCREVWLLKEGR